MNDSIASITIRATDNFPEPEFSQLQRRVFAELELGAGTPAAIARAGSSAHQGAGTQRPMFRLGAYENEQLVGWSYGWMERDNVFYMANSGVIDAHRRRGIYTLLLRAILQHAASEGASAIRSRHSVVNRPVIIAKLREGFNISGLSQSARMGALVELTLHLTVQDEDLYRQRVLPYRG